MTDQAAFRAGLLNPAEPAPHGLQDGASRPAGKRYDVYRNNVTHSLIEAMKAAFPLVLKLIGPQGFTQVATLFIRAHPPQSPVMMFYGVDFPDFLSGFQPLGHIGYLPDAARLDLEMRHAYHAADTQPFDAQLLQSLPPEALLEATITLAPATRLIHSVWPLHDIWRFNQNVGAAKPRNMPQDVMITRPGFDPAPHLLPPGALHWLSALAQGATFGDSHDIALAQEPTFDLAAALTLALQTQAFADIQHKDLK